MKTKMMNMKKRNKTGLKVYKQSGYGKKIFLQTINYLHFPSDI